MSVVSSRIAIVGNQAFALLNFRGDLIKSLVASGQEVYALAPDFTAETEAQVRSLGATPARIFMARTGKNPLQDASTVLSVYWVLRRLKPDVVLNCSIKPAIYGTIGAWLSRVGRRYILIEGLGHSFGDAKESNFRRYALRFFVANFLRLACGLSTKVFLLNNDDLNDLVALRVLRREKSKNVGAIGVNLDEWQKAPSVTAPLTFAYVGRLLKEKGVLDFIEASRIVKQRHPSVRILLVGGVDENASSITKEMAEAWVREGLIEWPGHVVVGQWLAQTSVFVLPSYYREGVPRSTQEAMAMGRAVITTDWVGCRDTVVDGFNGFLVPPFAPDALALAMEKFILDPNLVVDMGGRSRRMAEEKFDAAVKSRQLMCEMNF